MTDEDEVRTALVQASKTRGKQAEIAAAFEVSHATVKRWVEGEAIPPAMKKLLRLYLFGEIPFTTPRPAGARAEDLARLLEFTPEEWRIVVVLATRAGQDPGQWIRSQILAYLAYARAPGAYPQTTVPSLKVASPPTGSDAAPNPVETADFPSAGPASRGSSSPGASSVGNA
jgi:hypothetical protein